MRNLLLFVFFILLFSACSTYYHAQDGAKFIFSERDTLIYTMLIETDSTRTIYLDKIYRKNDTIFTEMTNVDSTISIYENFLVSDNGVYSLQYYTVVSMTVLFYQIKQNLNFSFNPRKVGKMKEKMVFVWPEKGIKTIWKSKSKSSALDTIKLGDSLVQVLRVDVLSKQFYKSANYPKQKRKTKAWISYYYYRGLGPVKIIDRDGKYKAELIRIEKFKNN